MVFMFKIENSFNFPSGLIHLEEYHSICVCLIAIINLPNVAVHPLFITMVMLGLIIFQLSLEIVLITPTPVQKVHKLFNKNI